MLFLAAVIRPNSSRGGRIGYTIAVGGLLVVIAAVRSVSVGADTLQYVRYYPVIGSIPWANRSELRYESGYFLLNKVLFAVSDDPRLLIVVTSAFTLSVMSWFIYRMSRDVVVSFLLLVLLQVFAQTVTAMRQSIALAIVLLFVPLLLKRKYVWFVLGVLLATQFHATAIVLLVLIPLVRIRFGARTVLLNVAGAGVLFLVAGPLLRLTASNADQYSDYLAAFETSGGKTGVALMAGFYGAVLVAMTVCALQDGPLRAGATSAATFLLHASWLVLPMLALAFASNTYLRLVNYFVPFMIVGVPVAASFVSDRKTRQMVLGGLIAASTVFFLVLSLWRPEWYAVVPYESMWSER
nr:EpsG family protein [Cellulomonas uda]